MKQEDKVKLCRIVGVLLLADGELSDNEYQFFIDLMVRLRLSEEETRSVKKTINVDYDCTEDIESLRRVGAARDLMELLRIAASADGKIDPREQNMIERISQTIQYRLGSKEYILPLHQLEARPLSETYDVIEEIGSGAYGRVFKAVDRSTGQVCAVKRLNIDAIAQKDEDRFWREVKILSQLQSPYTVQIYGAGFDVNEPYMVLEFLEGETLFDYTRANGPMSVERVWALGKQLLEGLAEAHDHGVVHRDLKPENIMLVGRDREHAKILDFGIAGVVDSFKDERHYQITCDQITIGTPAYMPCEQLSQMEIARRETDIYAVGLILCECLMGRPVFDGDSIMIINEQMSLNVPAPIGREVLDGPLGEVLHRACQKYWMFRYGPPAELMEKIKDIEKNGDPEEIKSFYRGLYKVYRPADEMLQALKAINLSKKKAPRRQKKGDLKFLQRLVSRWRNPGRS